MTGLRLCQVYFAAAMTAALVFGVLCPPAAFEYDISMLRVLVLMAGGTVEMWLLSRHSSYARPVGIGISLTLLALALIDTSFFGAVDTSAEYIGYIPSIAIMVLECAGAAAVAIWLAFSPNAKEILSTQGDLEPGPGGHSWNEPLKERVKTQEFWRDLVILFVVFSLLGHWLEILFCRLIEAGVFMGEMDYTNAMLWNQWLFPFTAEGAAAVAIVFLLHPAARKITEKVGGRLWLAVPLSFLLNMLVCSSIDFTTGMVSNQDYSLWDYRDMPFNFMGQVCLQNSLVYTIAATLIVWVFYPLIDKGLRNAPQGIVNAIGFGLFGMYLFLAALHFVDLSATGIFG